MSTYPGIAEATTGSPAVVSSMSTMPRPSPPSEGAQRTSARGLLEVAKGAVGSRSKVVCDALTSTRPRAPAPTWSKTTWQRRVLAFLGGASANHVVPTSSLRKKPAGIVTASGTLILRAAAYEEPIQGETGRWRH
jgi:hypothetical protein